MTEAYFVISKRVSFVLFSFSNMTSTHEENDYEQQQMTRKSPNGSDGSTSYDPYNNNNTNNSEEKVIADGTSTVNGYNGNDTNLPGPSEYPSSARYSAPTSNTNSYTSLSKPDDERKLFVGGLTWDTTNEDLRDYFQNFGQIMDISIKHDPATGRSRGFAFLVFDSKEVVEKILSQNDHFVKGRKVDPKSARRRLPPTSVTNAVNPSPYNSIMTQQATDNMNNNSNTFNQYNNNRKVFIGGLDPNFPDGELRTYFSQFGKIEEIDLPYDKEKNERRPFCFISFETEQAAQDVLRIQRHSIGDITVDVKRAKPKVMTNQQQNLYDPYQQAAQQQQYAYGQQSAYGYGQDPYAAWNAYAAYSNNPYSYSSTATAGSPSAAASTYPGYSYPTNSGYPPQTYDYSSYYASAPPQTTGSYDPQAYATQYDYASQYYGNLPGQDNMTNNDNSLDPTHSDYDHDSNSHSYGKAKTSIIQSPTYHPYSRS
ncbi:unnamed protein product [Didymodactylos carnosus]|uniref:RRM domain-containing protein n=1 Tax=Didymodactylos carnosus TaxID=1234261 RepID=A0A8S2HUX0_9BILA|nr:unnamed protein product [Didymodactylos carnosus]CAF3687143.1 unnamed protein product [Didymodactylos carnosus]